MTKTDEWTDIWQRHASQKYKTLAHVFFTRRMADWKIRLKVSK